MSKCFLVALGPPICAFMSNGADRCNGRVNATKGTADDAFESWVAGLLMQSLGAKGVESSAQLIAN